ncbi:hypothetical protein [Xanthobacter sediminis]
MTDENGASQGVHYHYHFYGYGPAGGAAPQAGAPAETAPAYSAPQGAPQAGAPGNPQGPAQGGFPPGYPPPGFPPAGFPFAPGTGGQGGQTAAQGSQAQPGTGFNWHQHPAADSLIKGLVVGAGAAYLLTNETAQRTILRTAVQVWSFLQGGVEELKERLHDAEAEVAAAAPGAAAPAEAELPAVPSSEN